MTKQPSNVIFASVNKSSYMRINLIALFYILGIYSLSAQVLIPNASFEDWTSDMYGRLRPAFWDFPFLGLTQRNQFRTTDSHSGMYAVEHRFIEPYYDRIAQSNHFFESSYYKPTKFSFWYKSNMPDDTLMISTYIFNSGYYPCRNADGFMILDTASSFKLATYNIEYSPYVDCHPEIYYVGIQNSNSRLDSNKHLIIDDLKYIYTMEGSVFFDSDSDNIKSPNEHGLPEQVLFITPLNEYVVTNSNGCFAIGADTGSYTIEYLPNSYWKATNNITTQNFQINSPDTTIAGIDFGAYPVSDTCDNRIFISASPNRINSQSVLWVDYQNYGTDTTNGTVYCVLDTLLNVVDVVPIPSQINNDTLIFFFTDLFPGERRKIVFHVQNPDYRFIGDTLVNYASINNGCSINHTVNKQIIVGSHDPNDKLVIPSEGENGYVLHDSELQYTIRFQNTGNDTAFNIIIKDTLDANLDPLSLRIIGSSHPMKWNIEGHGTLSFTFNNILLPDSNVNELLSHGYVSYVIYPDTGLSENTVATNRASIYFDSNPPIVTNNTISTFVSEIPLGITIFDNLNSKIIVYPNPFTNHISIASEKVLDFQITDYLGKTILLGKTNEPIRTDNLSEGNYLLILKNEDTYSVKKITRLK